MVSEEYFHSVWSERGTVVLSVEETSRELGIEVDSGSTPTAMLVGKKACGDGAVLCRCERETSFLIYVSRLTWALY